LKKEYFSETSATKISKEPQPPLKGLSQNDIFGQPADIQNPMEEKNDVK
jgi:hypothetical protein